MSIISAADDCTKTAGSGMITTWALTGQTAAYTGALETDGYKIQATLVFTTPGNTSPTVAGEEPAANALMAYGTCIETLDNTGAALASGNTTAGNFALCHWLFFQFMLTANTIEYATDTGNYDWGETKYLT